MTKSDSCLASGRLHLAPCSQDTRRERTTVPGRDLDPVGRSLACVNVNWFIQLVLAVDLGHIRMVS